MPQNSTESKTNQNYLERNPNLCESPMTFDMRSRRFLNKSNTSWKYPAKIFVGRSIFHRKNIYRSIIIKVNLEVLSSQHIKMTEFCSRCCFCVRHEKRTDKLSVRQQSICCIKNARNALSRKHWKIAFIF